METLRTASCRKFSCAPEEFERRALAASLYPHAKIFDFLCRGRGGHFDIDRSMVNYCGSLRTLGEIEAELKEYARLRENGRFARRTLRVRISGRRLWVLAQQCFASS